MSLRGARKNLRRAGPRTQALVRAVEGVLLAWIAESAVVLNPDVPPPPVSFPGTLIGDLDGVYQVQRTHERLVLWIQDDAWSRYVVHCCARHHGIVSFSKFVQNILFIVDLMSYCRQGHRDSPPDSLATTQRHTPISCSPRSIDLRNTSYD